MAVTKPGRASKDKNVKSKKKNKLKKLAGTVLKYTPHGAAFSAAKKLYDSTKNKKPQTKKAKGLPKGLPAATPANPMVPERRKVKRTQGPGGGSGKPKIIKNKKNY
jgi:hypothetical protein